MFTMEILSSVRELLLFLIYRVRVRIDVYAIHSVIFPFLFVNIEKFCNKEKPLYMKKETLCLRRVDMFFKLV